MPVIYGIHEFSKPQQCNIHDVTAYIDIDGYITANMESWTAALAANAASILSAISGPSIKVLLSFPGPIKEVEHVYGAGLWGPQDPWCLARLLDP